MEVAMPNIIGGIICLIGLFVLWFLPSVLFSVVFLVNCVGLEALSLKPIEGTLNKILVFVGILVYWCFMGAVIGTIGKIFS